MNCKLGIELTICELTNTHWKLESHDVEAFRSPLLSGDTITVSGGVGCFLSE